MWFSSLWVRDDGVPVATCGGRSATGGAGPHTGRAPPWSPGARLSGAPRQGAASHWNLLPGWRHHGGHHPVSRLPQSFLGNMCTCCSIYECDIVNVFLLLAVGIKSVFVRRQILATCSDYICWVLSWKESSNSSNWRILNYIHVTCSWKSYIKRVFLSPRPRVPSDWILRT